MRDYTQNNDRQGRGGSRPERRGYESRPSDSGNRRGFAQRSEHPRSGERREFGERKNFDSKRGFGDREKKSFDNRNSFGGERKSFGERRGSDERKSFGERKGFGDKRGFGERKSFEDKRGFGEKRNFDDKRGFSARPKSSNFSDRKSFDSDCTACSTYGSKFGKPKAKFDDQPQRRSSNPRKHMINHSEPMRLNKFLANSNICSRREADEFIQAGVVSVNGQIVTELGTKVIPATDRVHFHDQLVSIEKKVYLLLNKPKNTITTSDDPQERQTVMDLVKDACPERIYPVGRLDRNTTGVLLLTNDGDLTAKLTHPKFEKKKIYQVRLDKDLTQEHFDMLLRGITLEDGDIKADGLEYIKEDSLHDVGIEIHSGKNRIVRRMFESLGYRIVALDRVSFAGLTKKNLPRGRWRFLSESEINFLKMN